MIASSYSYAVEKAVRGFAPDARLAARRQLSAPIVAALKPWLEKQLSHISKGSKLAEHIRYTLGAWDGLVRPSGPSSAFGWSTGPSDRFATGS